MYFDRYAGMASAVGIMLIFTIIIWIDAWGPLNIDTVARWQTLIGSLIAGLGIFAASWNVTRQMRLAARGREQDRIERELPGNRAALNLATRIYSSGRNAKINDVEQAIHELNELQLASLSAKEFPIKFDEAVPGAPDTVRRELGLIILNIRNSTTAAEYWRKKAATSQFRSQFNVKVGEDSQNADGAVSLAQMEHAKALTRFSEHMASLNEFKTMMSDRIRAERAKLDVLRNAHERFLGL